MKLFYLIEYLFVHVSIYTQDVNTVRGWREKPLL